MIVCYFGIYDSKYSRNRIIIDGLKKNNIKIIECNSRKLGAIKYIDLFLKHRKIKDKYDVMIVGFPGYQVMMFAKLLTRKKIIFDAFFSFYDAVVNDRKKIKKYSLNALYLWLLDFFSCRLSDFVLVDTIEHVKYFIKSFNLKANKIMAVYIGANENIFFKGSGKMLKKNIENHDNFIVHFHGSYIPSMGIEKLVQVANILKNEKIIFNIIGNGQEYDAIKKEVERLKIGNVIRLNGFLKTEELLESIMSADLCLGIFGEPERTKRIISNKIFECIAMRKPVLTFDTPAIKEAFDEDQIFLTSNDPNDIANKIVSIKNDRKMLEKVSKSGFNKYINSYTSEKVVFELVDVIKNFYARNK